MLLSVFPVLWFWGMVLATDPPGETRAYDIFWKDQAVGVVLAEKKVEQGLVIYSTISQSEIRLLGRHAVEHCVTAAYRKGILQWSEMTSTKNGRLKNDTRIRWKGDHYEIEHNGAVSVHREPIRMSTAKLYFVQPRLGDRVFSEKDAVYKTMEGPSRHAFTLTGGKRNDSQDYYYRGGELYRIEIRHPFFSVDIRRRTAN